MMAKRIIVVFVLVCFSVLLTVSEKINPIIAINPEARIWVLPRFRFD